MVEPSISLEDFVHGNLLRTGHRCFVVLKNDHMAGLITLHEVKGVDKEHWHSTLVQDVMLPLEKLKTVSPDDSLTKALDAMSQNDINQLPVVLDGRFKGLISREQIFRYLQTRTELHV